MRAAGVHPALPVHPVVDDAAGPVDAGSPLVGLRRPVVGDHTDQVVLRRLDRGRLYAPALIDALGWPCPARLDADVSHPQTVLLRPATGLAGRFAEGAVSTSRPHLDRSGRLVLPVGIRCHLGIDGDAEVVAVARDAHLEIVTVTRMLDALGALATLDSLGDAAGGPVLTRRVTSLASIHPVVQPA